MKPTPSKPLFYVAHSRLPDGSRVLRWPQAANRKDTFILNPDGRGIFSRDCETAVSFPPASPGAEVIKEAFRAFDADQAPQQPPTLPQCP